MKMRELLTDAVQIQAFCLGRFDVSVSRKHAEQWAKEWREKYWSDNDDMAQPLAWIKNRLIDCFYFFVPHVDPSEIRVTCELHFWPWEGEAGISNAWFALADDLREFSNASNRAL